MVMSSNAAHTTLHRHGCDESILEKTADGSYDIRKNIELNPTRRCITCGKVLGKRTRGDLCENCFKQASRRCVRPSKEELAKLVWKTPTAQLAQQFGVSDKAIEKWCKTMSINKPPRGYWAKVREIN